MLDWIEQHQAILWTLAAASVVVFVGSLLAMPAVVVRIRADYFAHSNRPASRWAGQHPLVRRMLRIGKNVLGYTFILAGLAMLVLPGQGLLTLLVGFLLIDFPRKYRLEQWLLRRRCIAGPINWLRRRAGHDPLHVAKHARGKHA
ncbi:MAG: PGPGW domain-containing protein [Planctomycetota bacterium]|nr:PGPGW domain-containing protein [Planctomycetota bacterium]